MMQTPQTLCVLATFVSVGISLECESCQGIGPNCVGPMYSCPFGYDKCGIILSETTTGLRMQTVVKTCIPATSCSQGLSVINMGKAGRILAKVTCCVGRECQMISPTIPPIDTRPNGKSCPACYAIHNLECEDEVTECTGNQTYCLDVAGTASAAGMVVTLSMKGCTNEAVCRNIQASAGSVAGISVTTRGKCTKAPEAKAQYNPIKGRGTSSIPGLFELRVPVLVGFMLQMLLA